MMLFPPVALRVRAVHDVMDTFHHPLLVQAEDGGLYYLKYAKTQLYQLTCEWLCHYLLRLWDVATPDIAVLSVPARLLETMPLTARDSRRWLHQPAFGSRQVVGAIESSEFTSYGTAAELAMLSNPDDLLWISLFDAWVANDDRRVSHHNLLLGMDPDAGRRRLRCYAIDHAFTFTSQPFEALDASETYYSFNVNLSQAPAARVVLEQWRAKWPLLWASEYESGFYLRVQKCRLHFPTICRLLPEPFQLSAAAQTKVADFLFNEARLAQLWAEFFSCLP
jgi:hypothetical protein